MATLNDYPKPKYITGGCLCGSLKYRVDFPEGHEFIENSGTCQCTQCRKSTSSLFFMYHRVEPRDPCFKWTSSTDTLKHFQATPGNSRGFCGNCGSMIYWRRDAGPAVSIGIGTVDPLFLFGGGADGTEVPKGGFGLALAGGGGGHEWTQNEIPGVTDKLSILGFERGERSA